jgi:hypothetical protein
MALHRWSMFTVEQISQLDRDNLLAAWQDAATEAKLAVDRERELRLMAFKRSVPEPIEGTNTLTLGNGYVLKAVHKLNYSVSSKPEPLAALHDALTRMGGEIASKLVRWKPEISGTNYKLLDEMNRQIIAPLVTIKPGLPELSILAPGEAGNKR